MPPTCGAAWRISRCGFVTDQINLTTGRDGEVVTGSDAVTELTDVWTFQRDLNAGDPTWKLVAPSA